MEQTENLRIAQTHPLLTPALLAEELPFTEEAAKCVTGVRKSIESILDGSDGRMLVVVGPCSVHDIDAVGEYAEKLKPVADSLSDKLLIVMRVYFEKPRSVVGWKGLINDPDLDGSCRINKGLRLARRLLVDLSEIGLGAATEFLDTTFGQFYTDLVSWGAIGARTAESQIHRQLASGLSMPVGIKNRPDGDVQVAIDAILSSRHRHVFPSLTKQGAPAVFETTGNDYCHLILRGGSAGPNYSAEHVISAKQALKIAGLPQVIMIDCSHANSNKEPARQKEVIKSIVSQRANGETAIRAMMIESHLLPGRQDIRATLDYGVSITDGCLGFDETVELLNCVADEICVRRLSNAEDHLGVEE